jgi:dienelactone hydrolase
MKKYYPTLIRVLFCTLLFVCARCASAQYQYARYVSTGPNSGGYYEYVPAGYNSYQNTKKYPLIVFLHGAGQFGNGDSAQLPRVLATAIPHLIAEHQWPDSFKVNGSTFQFIVISPQFSVWPSDDDVNGVVQYAMTHYRVDTGRVYLTGLSMGGLATWSYASYPQWAGLLAAIVPTSADSNFPGLAGAKVMAENNLPIFATHNRYDNYLPLSGDIYNINLVNDSVNPPIKPTAQLRIFEAYGHDSWDSTYNPKTIMYQGLNIYQWMLLYTRDPGGSPPPPPTAPVIHSFTPTSGGLGVTVMISGKNFTGTSSVSFGGDAASTFTVRSDSVIVAIVNNGASGPVKVANSFGAGSLAEFTFLGPPVITSFTPESGSQGITVTIRGTGFSSANSVSFGGTAANAFTIASDTVITAIVGTGASGSVRVTTSYGNATLAGFSFDQPPPPVPGGFITFTAVPVGSLNPEVQLSWSDSSELDNRFFIVQRSTDSIQFSTIDTVTAVPGMTPGSSYSYIDPNAIEGPDYYRIFQVHVDGTASVSPIRKVVIGQGGGPDAPGLSLSPNPATSSVFITIGGSTSETLEIRLIDLKGNILRTWLFQKTANNWIQAVDIGDLLPGTYFIQAFSKNWNSAKAFMKK